MTATPNGPVMGVLSTITHLAVCPGTHDVEAELRRALGELDETDLPRLVFHMVDYTGHLIARSAGFDRANLPDTGVFTFDLVDAHTGAEALEDAPAGVRWVAQAVVAAANGDDISDWFAAVAPVDERFVSDALRTLLPLLIGAARAADAWEKRAKAALN